MNNTKIVNATKYRLRSTKIFWKISKITTTFLIGASDKDVVSLSAPCCLTKQ